MKVDGLAEKTVENEQCVGFDADDNMKDKIKIQILKSQLSSHPCLDIYPRTQNLN